MLLNSSKLKKSFLSSVDNVANNLSKVSRKTMFTTRNIANKAVNMNLIRSTNTMNTQLARNMSCVHAGKIDPMASKPKVTNTDVSGQHDVVVRTECSASNCKNVNCADPKDKDANCPSRTAYENQQTIPPTSQGFTSKIVGNTTGKIPSGKPGIKRNSTQNYKGHAKAQHMVEEKVPVTIDSKDIILNPQSTAFVQGHNQIIANNIP